jgi:hypothetical protein
MTAICEPTDKSKPPAIKTNVKPTVTMVIIDICLMMFMALLRVKNGALSDENTIIRGISTKATAYCFVNFENALFI